MPVVLSTAKFLGIVTLLALCASPETRYKMLRDVFWWFDDVFLGSIPVSADNGFQ